MSGVNPPDADRPIPPCPKCGTAKVVVPLYAVGLRKGAHCYTCKDCGYVFGQCVEEERIPAPTVTILQPSD
jgi:predicted RNA-binding Zn-ribbon protein involved in translation (DUF1610 family)